MREAIFRCVLRQCVLFGVLAVLTGLSLLFHPIENVFAAPSFDCNRATSRVEKLICSSDTLQQLDRQMAERYSGMKQNLSDSDRALLRDSQKAWIKVRNRQSEVHAVEQSYRTRLGLLESGLISLSFSTRQLPAKIGYGEGKELHILSKISESKDESARYKTLAVLIQHGDGKSQKLLEATETIRLDWNEVESADYIDSVEAVYSPADKAFVVILHRHDQPFRGTGSTASEFYIRSADGNYSKVFATGSEGSYSSARMPDILNHSHGYWQRDNATGHLQFLRVDEQRGGVSYHLLGMKKSIVDFDFINGTVSTHDIPLFEKDLEPPINPDAVARYVETLNRLLMEGKDRDRRYPDPTRCKSLTEAIGDFQALYEAVGRNGISWEQFIYGASRLSGEASKVHFPDRMILLAQELLRYKTVIENTADWLEKFRSMVGAGTDYELYESYGVHEGFPSLNQCQEFAFDRWAYGFWARRYLDDQFELTGNILESGLKAVNKPYKFDAEHAPEAAADSWKLESVLGKTYCSSINASNYSNGETRFARGENGQLHGVYTQINGVDMYVGSLESCKVHESRVVLCRWRDWNGEGNAQFVFNVESTSFSGGYDESSSPQEYSPAGSLPGSWDGKLCGHLDEAEKERSELKPDLSRKFLDWTGSAIKGFDYDSNKILGDGGARIAGKVKANGQPVVGLKLRLNFNPDINTRWVTTDSSGEYHIDIPPGRYEYAGFDFDRSNLDQLLPGMIMPENTPRKTMIEAREGEVRQAIDFSFAEPVRAVAPLDGDLVTGNDLVFRWQPYKGADYYAISVYSRGKGGQTEAVPLTGSKDDPWVRVDASSISADAIVVKPKSGEFYKWSVRAYSRNRQAISKTDENYEWREFKVE